jgi:hypothetical protein
VGLGTILKATDRQVVDAYQVHPALRQQLRRLISYEREILDEVVAPPATFRVSCFEKKAFPVANMVPSQFVGFDGGGIQYFNNACATHHSFQRHLVDAFPGAEEVARGVQMCSRMRAHGKS